MPSDKENSLHAWMGRVRDELAGKEKCRKVVHQTLSG